MTVKQNKEEQTNFKGAFVSVLIVGAVIVGMWSSIWYLYISRL